MSSSSKRTSRKPRKKPRVKLLGNIFTQIAGMQYYETSVVEGQPVQLELEPENPHDRNAIRVENEDFQATGHVPRRVSSWLTPLMSAGEVWAEGRAGSPVKPGSDNNYLQIDLFLYPKGKHILDPGTDPADQQDAMHKAVLAVWLEMQQWTDPEAAKEAGKRLLKLDGRDLAPRTRMLLWLIRSWARASKIRQEETELAGARSALKRISIGKGSHHHNLTVFPLLTPDGPEPSYALLQDSLAKKSAEIREVSEEGSIPELTVENRSPRPLLIPAGEILIGAKQDRTVNITILIPKKAQHVIPVSCVEQGRWAKASGGFSAAHFAHPALRGRISSSARASRKDGGSPHSDQQEVWRTVAECMSGLEVHSETGTLADAYAGADERLEEFRNRLVPPENAAGVMVVCGDQVVGMDLFDSPATFQKMWPRVSEAYFLEAAGRPPEKKAIKSTVRNFQQVVGSTLAIAQQPVGVGRELELTGKEIAGSGVWNEGSLCHLCAFPVL
ncbi:MAG: HIRAN domain-containing protein [Gemmatimonadales bacterium]|nr:HIRAN domain-containing protein [Gemmatimonadales bacterium]